MSYLSPIPSHWIHSVHPSTNLASRAASPDHPRGVRPTNNTNSTLTNSNSNEHQLRDNAIERSNRFNSRSAHLPFRGVYHQRNRLVRAIHSKPPVATTVDADEVSDEEIALDNRVSIIGSCWKVKVERETLHVRLACRVLFSRSRSRKVSSERLFFLYCTQISYQRSGQAHISRTRVEAGISSRLASWRSLSLFLWNSNLLSFCRSALFPLSNSPPLEICDR